MSSFGSKSSSFISNLFVVIEMFFLFLVVFGLVGISELHLVLRPVAPSPGQSV